MTSELHFKDALDLCEATTDIDQVIELTKHPHPKVRQSALREMCPCHVKDDITEFWERVFEMLEDPASIVRYQVLHTLCDGSPTHLEERIMEAVEKLSKDQDAKVKRTASRVLNNYRSKGKWNIM